MNESDGTSSSLRALAGVKGFLPGSLADVIDEPDTGPFQDDLAYLQTLEAYTTLQVMAYKLGHECQQRVISFASRDFGDASAAGVRRALDGLPLVHEWVARLRRRLDVRGELPCTVHNLKARFVRMCEVYELSEVERRLFGALLMMRSTHAFTAVKLTGSVGYGGSSSIYGSGSKPGVTLASIIDVSLTEVSAFQKAERRHVKQGVVTPGAQLITELPSLQSEAVVCLLALPLTESQLFNIEKSDLMRVLREEPGFDESKLAPKKRQRDTTLPVLSATEALEPGGNSLYSLLQQEAAAEHSSPTKLHALQNGKDPIGTRGDATNDGSGAGASSVGTVRVHEGEANSGEGGEGAGSGRGATRPAKTARSDKFACGTASEAMDMADGAAPDGVKCAVDGKAKEAEVTSGKEGEGNAKGTPGEADAEEDDIVSKPRNGPYEGDLEYLQDQFQLVKLRADIARVRRNMEERGQQLANTRSGAGGGADGNDEDGSDDEMPPMHMDEGYWGMDEYSYEMEAISRSRFGRNMRHEHSKQARHEIKRARKLQARADRLGERIANRLAQMAESSIRLPRLERLAAALGLCDFEKNVVVSMIGQAIAPRSIGLMGGRMDGGGGGTPSKTMQVEVLLRAFSHSLQQQIEHRKHFYKSAVLVREGILVLHGDELGADLTQTLAEIDRRMLDFVVGLDTEFSELMDGSHLYTPQVSIEEVVLADSKKTLVLDTVKHFDTFTQASRKLELHKKLAYGRGLVLLFYGPSGTGKTMMANALAALIGKKVLMINFPALGANSAGAILKLVFREAKIHDAILFFDECESIFMDRTKGNLQVNTVLTELERHEGLCILATNRPMDLDEAMHRRITLAIEFSKPDLLLREKIWRSMAPPKLPLADDVDFMLLARKYELQGGFIKNAWLSALSIAVARDGLSPTVTMADLHSGASHQLRGRLAMAQFDRGIVPQHGLEEVVLPSEIKEKLRQIVNYSKAQAVLFGQWGFQQQHGRAQGISALFHGEPGTGKTMAAEAIGFDVGRPLMVVNCAQLMDKYVGESAKNIEKVFIEAKGQDAVLVFDEAEGLFATRTNEGGSTSRHDSMNVGILLHHMEEFSGIVVAITNRYEQVDTAFHRRFKFIMEFPMPEASTRSKLWRQLIPKTAPLAEDVEFTELGNRFEITGGHIKSAVFKAAVEASLNSDSAKRIITMAGLVAAGQDEVDKNIDGKRPAGMYT